LTEYSLIHEENICLQETVTRRGSTIELKQQQQKAIKSAFPHERSSCVSCFSRETTLIDLRLFVILQWRKNIDE